MSRIHRTKTGQPYILLANGRAKFIKRSSARSHSIKQRGGYKMVKRHKARRRYGGSSINLKNTAIGGLGFILYENYISPMIPINSTAKHAGELIAGLYFAKRGGIMGNIAKTAVVLNTYILLRQLTASAFGGSSSVFQ